MHGSFCIRGTRGAAEVEAAHTSVVALLQVVSGGRKTLQSFCFPMAKAFSARESKRLANEVLMECPTKRWPFEVRAKRTLLIGADAAETGSFCGANEGKYVRVLEILGPCVLFR